MSGVLVLTLAAVAVVGVLGLAVAGFVTAPGPTGPAARRQMLQTQGYAPLEAGRWVREVGGLSCVFEEGDGWRWSVQLPRYGTLRLRIREREGQGMSAFGRGTFLLRDARLDERFVVASEQCSQTLDLLADPFVREDLLALPWVSLRVEADELVLEDPRFQMLQRLAGVQTPGTALAEEAEIHRRVAAALRSVTRRLYASTSVILEA